METLKAFVTDYNFGLIIGLIGFSFILFITNIISSIKVSKMTKKYDRLVEGVREESLENMLFEHLDQVKEVKNQLNLVEEHCTKIDNKLKNAIQRIGMVRYNAFGDMGSDLSFSLALLDDKLNGLVITNLYGRNESTTYGKPIVNGKSRYDLSEEELQAIDKAKQS